MKPLPEEIAYRISRIGSNPFFYLINGIWNRGSLTKLFHNYYTFPSIVRCLLNDGENKILKQLQYLCKEEFEILFPESYQNDIDHCLSFSTSHKKVGEIKDIPMLKALTVELIQQNSLEDLIEKYLKGGEYTYVRELSKFTKLIEYVQQQFNDIRNSLIDSKGHVREVEKKSNPKYTFIFFYTLISSLNFPKENTYHFASVNPSLIRIDVSEKDIETFKWLNNAFDCQNVDILKSIIRILNEFGRNFRHYVVIEKYLDFVFDHPKYNPLIIDTINNLPLNPWLTLHPNFKKRMEIQKQKQNQEHEQEQEQEHNLIEPSNEECNFLYILTHKFFLGSNPSCEFLSLYDEYINDILRFFDEDNDLIFKYYYNISYRPDRTLLSIFENTSLMVLLRSIYIKNVFCDYDELELVNKINEEINLSRMQTQTMNTLINFTHNHPQDTNNNNSMMINPILSSMRLFNMRKNNKRKMEIEVDEKFIEGSQKQCIAYLNRLLHNNFYANKRRRNILSEENDLVNISSEENKNNKKNKGKNKMNEIEEKKEEEKEEEKQNNLSSSEIKYIKNAINQIINVNKDEINGKDKININLNLSQKKDNYGEPINKEYKNNYDIKENEDNDTNNSYNLNNQKEILLDTQKEENKETIQENIYEIIENDKYNNNNDNNKNENENKDENKDENKNENIQINIDENVINLEESSLSSLFKAQNKLTENNETTSHQEEPVLIETEEKVEKSKEDTKINNHKNEMDIMNLNLNSSSSSSSSLNSNLNSSQEKKLDQYNNNSTKKSFIEYNITYNGFKQKDVIDLVTPLPKKIQKKLKIFKKAIGEPLTYINILKFIYNDHLFDFVSFKYDFLYEDDEALDGNEIFVQFKYESFKKTILATLKLIANQTCDYLIKNIPEIVMVEEQEKRKEGENEKEELQKLTIEIKNNLLSFTNDDNEWHMDRTRIVNDEKLYDPISGYYQNEMYYYENKKLTKILCHSIDEDWYMKFCLSFKKQKGFPAAKIYIH
ncbi:hypothetical protein H8356DRAFT_1410423 [Neocallimastix lanati (nom. inval.)]|nr:hypothetical protein H8356DRAFT_1410423 [Neocallimastix sp. JGI-2020a]